MQFFLFHCYRERICHAFDFASDFRSAPVPATFKRSKHPSSENCFISTLLYYLPLDRHIFGVKMWQSEFLIDMQWHVRAWDAMHPEMQGDECGKRPVQSPDGDEIFDDRFDFAMRILNLRHQVETLTTITSNPWLSPSIVGNAFHHRNFCRVLAWLLFLEY